jgi:hypothetical protein
MRGPEPIRLQLGILRGLFGLGLAAFALALAFGSLHALRDTGRMPAVDGAYGPYLQDLFARGDRAGALGQLRTAASLDFENRARVLPLMAALAREDGHADTEIWALRQLLRLYPGSPELRRDLEEAEARAP